MATVWFDGIDALNSVASELERRAGQIGERGSVVLRASALRIEALAKQLVPVDTGHLRSSIGADFFGDGRYAVMRAEIGPTASYGPYVEYGTHRMAPQAYMGPALDRVAPDFVAAVDAIAEPLDST